LSSFLATFPSDEPAYIVYVLLDEPKGTKETYGFATAGWTAAPLAHNVIRRIAPILGVKPRHEPDDDIQQAMLRLP
jgi:cell division protein FtsI (penicillin-binding protein 3)